MTELEMAKDYREPLYLDNSWGSLGPVLVSHAPGGCAERCRSADPCISRFATSMPTLRNWV
jgi:hypothetical protein